MKDRDEQASPPRCVAMKPLLFSLVLFPWLSLPVLAQAPTPEELKACNTGGGEDARIEACARLVAPARKSDRATTISALNNLCDEIGRAHV